MLNPSSDPFTDMVASYSPFVHLKAKANKAKPTKMSKQADKPTLTKADKSTKTHVLTNKKSNKKFATQFDHPDELVTLATQLLDILVAKMQKHPGLYVKKPSYHGRPTGTDKKKKCKPHAPKARSPNDPRRHMKKPVDFVKPTKKPMPKSPKRHDKAFPNRTSSTPPVGAKDYENVLSYNDLATMYRTMDEASPTACTPTKPVMHTTKPRAIPPEKRPSPVTFCKDTTYFAKFTTHGLFEVHEISKTLNEPPKPGQTVWTLKLVTEMMRQSTVIVFRQFDNYGIPFNILSNSDVINQHKAHRILVLRDCIIDDQQTLRDIFSHHFIPS